jgi:hypothetical protein
VYNAGSYGTFIEWSLNYFSGLLSDNTLPFRADGSSHNFKGSKNNELYRSADYIKESNDLLIFKIHPKTYETENIFDNLTVIDSKFKHVIYLYPTVNSLAWNINNKFEKLGDGNWLRAQHFYFLHNLKKWGIDSFDSAQRWQLREFLSLFIYPQQLAESELININEIQSKFSKFKFVPIESLRDNFKQTILSLLDYCNFTHTNIDQIEYVYSEWIKLQYHCRKDQLINEIVTAVINNVDYSWSNLTLADEALIQYYLREQHMEIRCFDLNVFPSNTHELKKYLYTI